jgi:radical SAM-linked protein
MVVCAMRNLRFVFEKKGRAAYLSHLDVMRTFSRSFHRAEIPLRYTEGFNPHPFISIAHPLSVGVTGSREILDCDVLTDDANLIERVNKYLPEGLKTVQLSDATRKVNEIAFAKYQLTLYYDNRDRLLAAEWLSSLFEKSYIPVMKKSKRGMVEINLAESIDKLKIDVVDDAFGDELKLSVLIKASPAPLNPRYLIESIVEDDLRPDFVRYHREGFLDMQKQSFV